jgi:hypothetical protein
MTVHPVLASFFSVTIKRSAETLRENKQKEKSHASALICRYYYTMEKKILPQDCTDAILCHAS